LEGQPIALSTIRIWNQLIIYIKQPSKPKLAKDDIITR